MSMVVLSAVQVSMAEYFEGCSEDCHKECTSSGHSSSYCTMKCETDCGIKELKAKLVSLNPFTGPKNAENNP
ncbi:hypothetical protein HAX54_021730 [Datura stramonium]|uniref:Uncharacterized protein n=1 Tax=Datura stramonium TaxID=4076 RepID=A0ABS8UVJ3_DATST|nr:hypothetical protein [Datura stramonium]